MCLFAYRDNFLQITFVWSQDDLESSANCVVSEMVTIRILIVIHNSSINYCIIRCYVAHCNIAITL